MKSTLITIFTLLHFFLFGQTPDGKKEMLIIKSDVYKTDRKIAVYLPPNYEDIRNEKLQVVYVFDGQSEPLFNYVANSISYLSAMGELNHMIVVGIYTKNRPKEFIPMPVSKEEKDYWNEKQDFGFSALLDKHLTDEVFPLIEKKYNANKYKLAIGHSLGGTYLVNSFADGKKIFNSYIAISPNLEYDNDEIQNKVKMLLKNTKSINSFLNISIGDLDQTEKKFTRGIKVLDTIISTNMVVGLKYRLDYLKDASHSTSPFKEIPIALLEFAKITKRPNDDELLKMLNNKQISFSEGLKNYYKNLSNWVGYEYLPSENQINNLAYFSLNNKNAKEGLNIENWALELYPNSINLYDSKAEMLENLNQKDEAQKTAKIALEKLEKNKPDAEDYKYYKNMLEKHIVTK
jgi:predicted alpha/beta superfamily hydrolase